jgi:small GTP-binding protein
MNESLPCKEDDLSEIDLVNSNTPYTKRKILLLGGQNVGKTALIQRYKNNTFTDEYEPTIQIITKKVTKLNNEYIDLEIIDMEGQTQYTIFAANKYAFGYNAYMLIYDVRDKKSFELIKYIYEKINNLSGKTSKILIGTKSDNDIDTSLCDRQVSTKEGKEFADKIHCPFIETSSQDNKNIEEAFRLLLIEINKTESGINLRQLKFYKIFKFFIHHPKLTVYGYYIYLIITILTNLVLLFLGVQLEVDVEKEFKNIGNGFPMIVFGLWEITFNTCGIIGMYHKSAYLLELNFYGLVYGFIYLIISIVQVVIMNLVDKDMFDNMFIYIACLSVCNILFLLISGIISYIFKIIYQNDLKSYIS